MFYFESITWHASLARYSAHLVGEHKDDLATTKSEQGWVHLRQLSGRGSGHGVLTTDTKAIPVIRREHENVR